MYWRRRIVAIVLLLIVIALVVIGITTVVRGVAGLFRQGPEPSGVSADREPSASASTPGTASPTETPTKSTGTQQVAGKACLPSSVTVRAATDAKSYAAKADPMLSLIVKNVSGVSCTIDVGTSQQEFEIMSGNDRIWSSKDCEDTAANKDDASNAVSFKAGDEKRSELGWKRIRSDKGCTAELPAVKPGTYTLTTRLGKAESKPVAFVIK